MKKNMLLILKVIAVISAIVLALIAILYVSDLFSGEYIKHLAERVMAVIGIISAVSLTIIFISNKKEQ